LSGRLPTAPVTGRALRVIAWFVNMMTDRRYEILDRQFFEGGFVQQDVLHANGRNGGSISMRVCIVINVGAHGLISRIDEYFDPAEIAPCWSRSIHRGGDMASPQELLSDPASVGLWNVDPNRSTIGFTCRSFWGLAPVNGRFSEFTGDGQITDTQTIFGRIDIKVASLNTKIGKRDNHLRSADFFDVERFPDISVVVTGADTIDGDNVDLRAELTVKSTTAALPLRAKVAVLADGSVRLVAQAIINRKDFGVDGNVMGMVVDKATISGDVVFRRG
jgi:polyisoprenoid-binding protein YceI